MKKAFSIIELLVALTVVIIVAGFIATAVNHVTSSDDDTWFTSPEIQTMHAQRRMADEMKRQNDLLERQLQIMENAQPAERP